MNKRISKDREDRGKIGSLNKTSGIKRAGGGDTLVDNPEGESIRRKKKLRYERGDEILGQVGEQMSGGNSFLFSGLEGVKRPTPLLTPTKIKIKQKKAYENENKNNKKITDWISGNYDTEVREKLGKSEGRQLVSVGVKGEALTLALEWGGTRTLSIEWEGGEAQSSISKTQS